MFNSQLSPFALDEHNELMCSDFFDTIQSVENGSEGSSHSDEFSLPTDYIGENGMDSGNCTDNLMDDLSFLSDSNSPINELNLLTDTTDSPIDDFVFSLNYDHVSDSKVIDDSHSPNHQPSVKLLKPPDTNNYSIINNKSHHLLLQGSSSKTVVVNKPTTTNNISTATIIQQQNTTDSAATLLNHNKLNNNNPIIKAFAGGKKKVVKVAPLTTASRPIILPNGMKGLKIIKNCGLKSDQIHFTTTAAALNSGAKRQFEPSPVIKDACGLKRIRVTNNNNNELNTNRIHVITVANNNHNLKTNVVREVQLKGFKRINESLKTDRIHVVTIPNGKCPIKPLHTQLANDDYSTKPLKLSPEELKGLDKLGIRLPSYHPLTKSQEGALKRVRRKIRNKISAQDSRKRKKEYVDSLEEKVKQGSEENRHLKKRINELQKTNNTLASHITKLQKMLGNLIGKKVSPSTCLTLFMLSMIIVTIRDMHLPKYNNNNNAVGEQQQELGTISRSLLSASKISDDDAGNVEEIFVDSPELLEKFFEENPEHENSTDDDVIKMIREFESKHHDKGHFDTNDDNNNNNMFTSMMKGVHRLLETNGFVSSAATSTDYLDECNNVLNTINNNNKNKKGFIEPDICEYLSDDEIIAVSSDNVGENQLSSRIMKLIDKYIISKSEIISSAAVAATSE